MEHGMSPDPVRLAGPWQRYWARAFDLLAAVIVLALALGVEAPQQ